MEFSKIIEEISPKNMRNEPKTPEFYKKYLQIKNNKKLWNLLYIRMTHLSFFNLKISVS